jgi:hypothetical protein
MEIKGYSSLWKAIIRPPRAQYDIADLGPAEMVVGGGLKVKRADFELQNQHGHAL